MLIALRDQLVTLIVFIYDLTEMIVVAFKNGVASLRHGTRPVVSVYLRQVYFTGLEAFRIILVISLIIGTVAITQIISIAGSGSLSLIGKVMVWTIVRELGPLLTAIIVVARSGTAIAAEISQMKIGGELDYLASLGIPAENYLIMPRILGVGSAVLMLTVYFEIAAVLGGFTVASLGWRVPWEQYAQGVFSVLTISELAASLLKSALFGLCIAAICCRQGLNVGRSVTQIPQAATRAVMQSLFVLFVIDGIVALLFLL
jgi:phospholipid/cholesterol/gamma-HCH transport system permease protein